MKVYPNQFGSVGKYCFKAGQQEKYFEVDPVSGISPIMHAKTFNPIDIWYGMSPLEAAMLGVDQYNSANRWNLSMLQNMASPSGMLMVESSDVNPGGNLTNEQYARMKKEFEESYQGSRNSGKPLILEGGVKWEQISLSPKEMDWIASLEVTAVDIANVFGVPPQLVGVGESTYSNYQEARCALFEETILPIMDLFQYELNRWLAPRFGDNLKLKYDKDDIEVLVAKRESKFSSLASANFLTQNEKRIASGYKEVDGWDVFIIGNQILENPDQWTTVEDTPPVSEDGEGETDNGEEESIEEETSSEEVIETDEESDEKGWKSFNLINQNEKQNNWRRVNAARKRLEKPFARSLETDFDELARDLEKAANNKDPRAAEYAMQIAIDNSMKDIAKTLSRHIKFTVQDFGQAIFQNAKSQHIVLETKKSEKTWSDWAEHYVKTRTGKAITEIEGTTRKKVRKVVQDLVREAVQEDADVNVAKELRSHFSELSAGRARNIARTEVGMASNNATIEAARSLEVPGLKKEWVSLQDDRTRDGDGPNPGVGANHLDMNGVQVELDDKFTVPPDADMDGPGDPGAEAGQVVNCRCTLVFRASRR